MEIPKLPRRPVHHGLGVDESYVQVFRMLLIDWLHGGSEAVVERLVILNLRVVRIT